MSKSAKLVLNQDEIERIDNNKCVRTLGVYIEPELKWNKQFEKNERKHERSNSKIEEYGSICTNSTCVFLTCFQ